MLGEIDEDKEANSNLKEVSLEDILEAQSKQQAAKEEQDRLRAKAFKERGLTYTAETAYEDLYWGQFIDVYDPNINSKMHVIQLRLFLKSLR